MKGYHSDIKYFFPIFSSIDRTEDVILTEVNYIKK